MWSILQLRYITVSLAILLLGSLTIAEEIQEWLSFGQHGSIWTEDHLQISGFEVAGDNGHHPSILSDRVVLTPPWPGNKRSSIWSEWYNEDEEWTASMDFRVTGPDHGSGNLQLWYIKEKGEVGTSSIYTVGKFDGLAIVIDQTGGHGGSIRAFLNDNTKSFKDHHHVESLAFGHCDFSYRNLGRFVNLEIKQSKSSFEVNVDHHSCFKTNKVHLPIHYFYGITAATSDNPDSIEVSHLIIKNPKHHEAHQEAHHEDHSHHSNAHGHDHHDTEKHHDTHDARDTYHDKDWYWTDQKEQVKDALADSFKTDASRFKDLHERVQYLSHQLDMIFHDLSVLKDAQEEKYKELLTWLSPIHDYASSAKHTSERMEMVVEAIRKDVETKEFKEHLEELNTLIGHSHASLMEHIPHAVNSVVQTSSPRFGFFVFILVATQIMLFGSYVVYRRRIEMQPKKFL